MPFKVKIVYEYEALGTEDEVIAEYTIDKVEGGKVKYLPATNLMKKDLLDYLKKEEEDAT